MKKKPTPESARVMRAGRGLSVNQFVNMANDLHAHINYRGCSKGSIIHSLLDGELDQKVYTADEIIAVIEQLKDAQQ